MLLNLSDVFASQGKIIQGNESIAITEFVQGDLKYPVMERINLSFVFANNGVGKAVITGKASVTFQGNCDRCLRETKISVDLDFTREICSPEVDEPDTIEDQADFMEGYYLNIENLVNNEILMNWPAKILCSNNCKGICKICGKDQNTGNCECDTFVPDPRMAKIKDIFNANKEV
jgi:uncharacterized protein